MDGERGAFPRWRNLSPSEHSQDACPRRPVAGRERKKNEPYAQVAELVDALA